MSDSVLLRQLIDALCCMPGVGKKSAQRIAYQLLQYNRTEALHLAQTLTESMEKIGHCQSCRNFSEHDICAHCNDARRDRSLLCVVGSPSDVAVIEATDYKGLFFVLMGYLSPLDGIGPADLGLDLLRQRLQQDELTEVILATGMTVEGEATAHYITEMVCGSSARITRIAHGVPMGGELEYIDRNTIERALHDRKEI